MQTRLNASYKDKVNLTTCRRCGQQLHPMYYYGSEGDWGTFRAWHCFKCGEIVDPLILANRRKSKRPVGFQENEWGKSARERIRAMLWEV